MPAAAFKQILKDVFDNNCKSFDEAILFIQNKQEEAKKTESKYVPSTFFVDAPKTKSTRISYIGLRISQEQHKPEYAGKSKEEIASIVTEKYVAHENNKMPYKLKSCDLNKITKVRPCVLGASGRYIVIYDDNGKLRKECEDAVKFQTEKGHPLPSTFEEEPKKSKAKSANKTQPIIPTIQVPQEIPTGLFQ